MMERFDFSSDTTAKALTGKLAKLKIYNAIGIPAEYFDDAMTKLRSERFLNRPLQSVSHPVSNITKNIAKAQKFAANKAAPVETKQLTAEEWFERGFEYDEHNKFDDAIQCFKKAIELNPLYEHAYYHLGMIFTNDLNRPEEAEFRKVIELDSSHADVYLNLGISLHRQNRYAEAKNAHQKALELDADQWLASDIYCQLGDVQLDQKQFDKAKLSYLKAIDLNRSNIKAYIDLGVLLCDHFNRYDEAETTFRKAIKIDPSEPLAHYNLGVYLSDQARLDEAETSYRKTIELIGESPLRNNSEAAFAYCNLGLLLEELKRYEEAKDLLLKAIELNPEYDVAHCHLGSTLESIQEFDSAELAYRKVLELNPSNHSHAYNNLGRTLEALERFKEAETIYRKGIDFDPTDFLNFFHLGVLLSNFERNDEALKLYNQAIRLNSDSPESHYNRALIWEKKKMFSKAIVDYQKYLELGDEEKNSDQKEVEEKIKKLKSKLAKKKPTKKKKIK